MNKIYALDRKNKRKGKKLLKKRPQSDKLARRVKRVSQTAKVSKHTNISSKNIIGNNSTPLDMVGNFAKKNPILYEKMAKDGLISPSFLPGSVPQGTGDDKMLHYYSKKLKLKNNSVKNNAFSKDGLDFVLDVINNDQRDPDTSLDLQSLSEGEGQATTVQDMDTSDGKEESMGDFDDDNTEKFSDLESEEDLFDSSEVSETDINEDSGAEERARMQEKSTQSYVPPQMRESRDSKSAKNERIRKKLQGLHNRMSEMNIESVFHSMESVYRENPRKQVTDILVQLIFNSICNQALGMEDFLTVNSCLITLIYNLIGYDIGAAIFQEIVERFDASFQGLHEQPENTKDCANLIVLICQLYNFKLTAGTIVFDILQECTKELREADVEIFLKVSKTCGSRLRHEYPDSFKNLIIELQKASKNSENQTVRFKFMLEQIYNIKNNKTSAKQEDQSSIEGRLKKLMRNMVKKRQIPELDPLRCSLDDIRSVKIKGKWWIVGAGWQGRQHGDELLAPIKTNSHNLDTSLEQAARALNINTDIRKSIFGVLMTSEDYVDAFDKLLKLGLKGQQEREIIRILVHCCVHEKAFNLYYALICERLCRFSHGHKITLQFTLWDFLKEITNQNNSTVRKISHMAKLYGFLVKKHALSLAILKIVDFSNSLMSSDPYENYPDPNRLCLFLQMFLINIIMDSSIKNAQQLREVFERISQVRELKDLCKGIQLILNYWIRKRLDLLPEAEIWAIVREYSQNEPKSTVKQELKEKLELVSDSLVSTGGY